MFRNLGFRGHSDKLMLYLAQLMPMNVLPAAAKTSGRLSDQRSGVRWQCKDQGCYRWGQNAGNRGGVEAGKGICSVCTVCLLDMASCKSRLREAAEAVEDFPQAVIQHIPISSRKHSFCQRYHCLEGHLVRSVL